MPARKKVVPKKRKVVEKRIRGRKRRSISQLTEFVSKYPATPEGIKKAALKLYTFLSPAKSKAEFHDAYNGWGVERILKEKRIPVLFAPGSTGKMRPKWGCYTMCRLMFSTLQEMGLKPKMARYFLDGKGPLKIQKVVKNPGATRPHTSVFFTHRGQLYNVDPFFPSLPVHKVSDKEMATLRELQKTDRFFFVKPGQIPFEEFEEEMHSGRIHPRKAEKPKD